MAPSKRRITLAATAAALVAENGTTDVGKLVEILLARWRDAGLEQEAIRAAARDAVRAAMRTSFQVGTRPPTGSRYVPFAAVPEREPDRYYDVQWVARARTERLNVGGRWVILDECSAAMLTQAAQVRSDQACALSNEAERLAGIAKRLEYEGVGTVADLSDAVLAELLAGGE